ncbi:helix-turn-helix transcriptional regulator [Panacibacter sp. DH6]|uniref:Helix-turn-helix transcriptional regulator n=1 Tax=Panacibacter microcysteis TaxID=2793269 RepID=A0A931E8F9_9BACT|nr:helix-turn-helix transcriptional regulator [Panacibacter microcysteis]
MVSLRCKMVVQTCCDQLKLSCKQIDLGEVEFLEALSPQQLEELKACLSKYGLRLMDDRRSMLVEQIKAVVIEMVHYLDELPDVKYSVYISEKLGKNYTYLANLFSEVKGITLEHYIILHKIEKIKELMLYDELSLSEIAYKLDYSSPAHLSNQFKKITGLTPSFFKKLKQKRSMPLEDL